MSETEFTVPAVTLASPEVAPFMTTEEAYIHALIGAPFGDLELDVGKSVRWTQWFVDDVFITDINTGDPRYWIVNWELTFPNAHHHVTGINYFVDPVAFRKEQFARAQKEPGILLEDNDWVLFVDAAEGMSCDSRSLPDDYLVQPFRSFIYREITRAVTAGRDNVVIPYFVFLRHDDIVTVDYRSPAVVGLGEEFQSIQQSMATPYYLPNQGLARLWKVSALKSPTFDWTKIDQPQPYDPKAGSGVAASPAYLNPEVGQVSTPNQASFNLVNGTKYRMTYKGKFDQALYSYCQFVNKDDGTRNYLFGTVTGNNHYYFAAGAAGDWVPMTSPVSYGIDHTIGIEWTPGSTAAVEIFDGVRTNRTWNAAVSATNTSAPVVVGDPSYRGRLDWAKLERLDAGGNVVATIWKFDPAERTGTGTTYTDPRGHVWTLTNANAIVPAVEAVPAEPAVKLQIVSYAYAHWNLQDIVPPDTEVPPLDANNDDGWRMRQLISKVRPQAGLPYTDPWKPPNQDVVGIRGPWAGQMLDAPELGQLERATFDASGDDYVRADDLDLSIKAEPVTWRMEVIPNTTATASLIEWSAHTLPEFTMAWKIHVVAGKLTFTYVNTSGVATNADLGTAPWTVDEISYLGVEVSLNGLIYEAVGITSDNGKDWYEFGTPVAIQPKLITGILGHLNVFYDFDGTVLWAEQDVSNTLVWRFSPADYRYDVEPPATTWDDPRELSWTVHDDPAKFTESSITPLVVPAPDPAAAGILVPLYDTVFRINLRDGVWYDTGQLGNVPMVWDNEAGKWVATVHPPDWHDTPAFVAPVA